MEEWKNGRMEEWVGHAARLRFFARYARSFLPPSFRPSTRPAWDIKVALGAAPVGQSGLAIESLKSKPHGECADTEKFDSSAISFAFLGF
jgi:hypothetical protein